jgi:hypothetical protein
MSRHDVEVFLEFNDRLTALDENFDTFDTAASPGRDPDGVISLDDLAAVAEGDGEAAATAAWLLAHGPLYDRVASYHAGGGPTADITRDSLVVLSVDQQVHADSAPDAAAFVDRHLDSLLSESVGASATGEGMYALFDSALTESDQRGEVIEHVIAKVAEEGAIHNPGLPLAFANGTAANMDIIHSLINDDFDSGGENGTESFESTHVFLRETMRDVDAAEVVLNASTGYFADRLDSLPDEGREIGLEETGRTLGVVTQAHANAGLSDATDSDDAATHQAAAANFLVGLIPYGEGVVGVANDFAEIGGVSFGDLVTGGSERPAAEEAARDYQYELEKVGAVAMTTHHYNEGTLERDAALTSMREHVVAEGIDLDESHLEGIFYDAEGAPRQRLSPSGMTDAQLAAFTDWANSSGGARPTGTTPATPLQNDYAHLSSGIGQANNRLNNEYGG